MIRKNRNQQIRISVIWKIEEKIKIQKKSKKLSFDFTVPETNAEKIIHTLKDSNVDDEDFDQLWQSCTKYRLADLRKANRNIQLNLEKWPQYKGPLGFRLVQRACFKFYVLFSFQFINFSMCLQIDMDFDVICSNGNNLINTWDECSEKLLRILLSHIKQKPIKEILCAITEDLSKSKFFIAIHILVFLFFKRKILSLFFMTLVYKVRTLIPN